MTEHDRDEPDGSPGWGADRAAPQAVGRTRRRMTRTERARASRIARRRRHRALGVIVVVLVATVATGAWLWRHNDSGDFSGDGVTDVVVQIRDGDSTTAIGAMLAERRVVATARAFVDAAAGNTAIASIQPGFYQVRTEIPARTAVDRLADKNNRVGRLVVPEGRQLDDTTDVRSGTVTDGVFTLIQKATCTDLNGQQRCVSADDLREAAKTVDPVALAVPEWALEPVRALGADHRRLEGLVAPGVWNVDPSASAPTILAGLIGAGAQLYRQAGLLDAGRAVDLSPYQVLTVASLVQKESKPVDFTKVARVIYNRLADPAHSRLQFDSTVNFLLDRQEVATTDADRAAATPWNTYVRSGLPATPICSPGQPALTAAEAPEPGDWLYFVTVDKAGTTLFTRDYQQHLGNIELAKRNGVLDSAR